MATKKEYFYGIKPIEFIWNWTQSDPEVKYKDFTMCYRDLETSLYELWQDEVRDDFYVNLFKWDEKIMDFMFKSRLAANPEIAINEIEMFASCEAQYN